jgi:hypothetical protein
MVMEMDYRTIDGNELDRWAAENGYRARYQGFLFPDSDEQFRQQIETEMRLNGKKVDLAERFPLCEFIFPDDDDEDVCAIGYIVAVQSGDYNFLVALLPTDEFGDEFGWRLNNENKEHNLLIEKMKENGADQYFDLMTQLFWWVMKDEMKTSNLPEIKDELYCL